jgi:fatty-acyl-CoA synthase
MDGLMINAPLSITSLMRFADRYHPDREIVSVTHDNPLHRTTYGETFERTRRLAGALAELGLRQGDRVATLAWNDYRHFEIYYATSCSGLVCHTINPRLFEDQIVYIVNHAQDRWIVADAAFAGLLERIADRLPRVEGYIILSDPQHMPDAGLKNLVCYEALLESSKQIVDWPDLDEQTAAALCYTSGTTGNPKGVLYSHRSTVLHAYSICLPDALGLSSRDSVMPVVPMFHVCAWGIPYAAPMVGAKLVLPGHRLGDGALLQGLIQAECVTCALGVPTVWLTLHAHLVASQQKVDSLERIVVGGAACPPSLIDAFRDELSVEVHHAWGMTETSPLGTFNRLKPGQERLADDQRRAVRYKQGRGVFGIEMKITDEENRELPRDGVAAGQLKVRGPFVASDYYRAEEEGDAPNHAFDEDGWFATGDVATIDPEGFMQIVDRTKDLIKSGGEWISSIELENVATGHPGIAMAAVIATPHETWGERPLLVAVPADADAGPSGIGSRPTREEILAWMAARIAKWQLPDDVVFVEALPLTATGKVNKRALRSTIAQSRQG